MKLHEYQSKAHFKQFDIPIPDGKLAHTPAEAAEIARQLGGQVVLKAQVLVSGRGQVGGIRYADTPQAAQLHMAAILGSNVHGYTVTKVLVDVAIDIQERLYLAITNDRISGRPVLMASRHGGSHIEDIARDDPGGILWEYIDPLIGLRTYQIRRITSNLNLKRPLWSSFRHIVEQLYACYTECDATLVEINPLVITPDGELIAIDGKLLIDDNALFRQQYLNDLRDISSEHPAETAAREAGFIYFKLDGDIGCMANGAGMAMTVMDMIAAHGGSAANFLDIRGGATAQRISTALDIILSDDDVRVVLVNIFGGITQCDEVAVGLLTTIERLQPTQSIIVRLQGNNAEQAKTTLLDSGITNIHLTDTLIETIDEAVMAAQVKA